MCHDRTGFLGAKLDSGTDVAAIISELNESEINKFF